MTDWDNLVWATQALLARALAGQARAQGSSAADRACACRWQYYVTNWDNLVWATQALLAGQPARHAPSAAAVEDYLTKWRRGQVVRCACWGCQQKAPAPAEPCSGCAAAVLPASAGSRLLGLCSAACWPGWGRRRLEHSTQDPRLRDPDLTVDSPLEPQVNYTRQGLAWSDQWGALRNTANAAMLALVHAEGLPAAQARRHQCWALSQLRCPPRGLACARRRRMRQPLAGRDCQWGVCSRPCDPDLQASCSGVGQRACVRDQPSKHACCIAGWLLHPARRGRPAEGMHVQSAPPVALAATPCWRRYMLGDGPRSFVVGYGKRPPQRPHHRAASCPPQPAACNHSALHSAAANPHELTGALVGGPSLQDTYADDRSDYVTSEVSAPPLPVGHSLCGPVWATMLPTLQCWHAAAPPAGPDGARVQVGIEYSAGFTAAVAGALQMRTSWALCQQGHR